MPDANDYPRCETLQDVESCSGHRVILAGTYHQVDLRMRRKPPPVYAGHAAVRLRDGTDVLLEPNWSSMAVRSAEERARYDGKSVEVIGVVRSQAPAPAEPTAYVVGPCVTPVEAIRSPAGEPLP